MATVASLRDVTADSRWTLEARESIIGRDENCEITIDVVAVSRRHAIVVRSPHGWSLRDLDSSNGTWVNGERLSDIAQPLRNDDEIVLAGSVTLRFTDPQATPMAPAIGRLTGVWIDPDSSAVWVDAQPIEPPLSERQQALIELLVDRLGHVVTREEIIDRVWADVAAEGVSTEALDALVKRVRSRIRPLQVQGEWLEVVRGRGIRLVDPDADSAPSDQ